MGAADPSLTPSRPRKSSRDLSQMEYGDQSGAKRKADAEKGLNDLRNEVGLGGVGGSQELEERLLELQAEKQMQDVRAKKLEEKLRDIELQKERAIEANARLQEETAELKRDKEEALQQLEVLTEERDQMQAATEQTWKEKVAVEEELTSVSDGYVMLTERLNQERDNIEDAEERVRQYEDLMRQLRAQLQENEERHVLAQTELHNANQKVQAAEVQLAA